MFKIPEGFKMQVKLEGDWLDIVVLAIVSGPFRYSLHDFEGVKPEKKDNDIRSEHIATIVYAFPDGEIYTENLGVEGAFRLVSDGSHLAGQP